MQLPLQVSFRDMEPIEATETLVREKASKLDRFASDIMSCRVVVQPATKRHRSGNPFDVRIDLKLSGKEIAVTRESKNGNGQSDLHVVIRDAFSAAGRQVEDYVRRRRGDVKSHNPLPHARVARLFPDEGYGFIATPDGREVYFHQNSVSINGFSGLSEGMEVTFVESDGDRGPQASTVKPVGRHHHL